MAEQLYPGEEDNLAHFMSLLDAFNDPRYIRVKGKLLFLIYQPKNFKNFSEFKEQWNRLAVEHGLNGFYFVGQAIHRDTIDEIRKMGFDAVNHCHRLDNYYRENKNTVLISRALNFIKRYIKIPFVISYKKAIKRSVFPEDFREDVYPTMMPNWDHTPRSGVGGTVLHNSTPELFEKHATEILLSVKDKADDNKIVFLKSWNEWGEGNYMEPDLRYGKGFINALRRSLQNYINKNK